MKQQAVDALVAAALRGDPQSFDSFEDDAGRRCALGVLGEAGVPLEAFDLETPVLCPGCGDTSANELELIPHLNDDHRWDFLTIARKLETAGPPRTQRRRRGATYR